MLNKLVDKFQLFCSWLIWDSNIKLGRLAPYVFGLSIGHMPKKVGYIKDGVEHRLD